MAAMRNAGFRMNDVNGKLQAYQVDLNLREANLVVFPAWLRHGVRPYRGTGERISVALNIDAVPKTVGRKSRKLYSRPPSEILVYLLD